ncbi:MAG TPA: lipopolysaccharide biosynthesis protein [Planctomycetota bacterium]|nr:lipopolysaccharide biosynthesis protein [Planctomycetota bacterium]
MMILRSMFRRRIVIEAAWVFAGQMASAAATLVGLRLITDLVSPSVYGTIVLVVGTVGLAHGLVAGPWMQSVLRLYPEVAAAGAEGELRRATWVGLRKPVIAALLLMGAPGAIWTLSHPEHTWTAVLALVLLAAEIARSVEVTFLSASRRQRAMALLIAVDAWLRISGALALVVVFGPSSAAVLGGYLLGCGATLGGYRLLGRRRDSGNRFSSPTVLLSPEALLPRMWIYALPLAPLPLIAWVSAQADRYLLAGMAGISAAGLYAAMYGLASKPFMLLSGTVDLALRQPYYTRVSAADHTAERAALALWLRAVTAGSLLLYLPFALFHRQIAALALGSDYRDHSALMAWIAAGYALLCMAQVFERVCYAYGDTRGVLWIQGCGALLSLAVAAPLVARWGIRGAAWAVPVSFSAQLMIAAARARRARRIGITKNLHFSRPSPTSTVKVSTGPAPQN